MKLGMSGQPAGQRPEIRSSDAKGNGQVEVEHPNAQTTPCPSYKIPTAYDKAERRTCRSDGGKKTSPFAIAREANIARQREKHVIQRQRRANTDSPRQRAAARRHCGIEWTELIAEAVEFTRDRRQVCHFRLPDETGLAARRIHLHAHGAGLACKNLLHQPNTGDARNALYLNGQFRHSIDRV